MGDNADLLTLSLTAHKVLLSIILSLLNNDALNEGFESILGIVSATYILICDILSYKESISNYGRFLRTVLHSFYTTPIIATAIKGDLDWQKN